MEIKKEDIIKLREETGAGIVKCKEALTKSKGDYQKAVNILREEGISVAAKKMDRIAAEGCIDAYIHMGGKIGVMVEVNCETDFVAKTSEFKTFCHDLTLHIAFASPLYLSIEDVPKDKIEEEKNIVREKAKKEGKPDAIIEKIAEGSLKSYFKEVCLLEQPFVKDSSKTIKQLVLDMTVKSGEKIAIRRFVKYNLGEGIEKKKENYVEEIEKIKKNAKK